MPSQGSPYAIVLLPNAVERDLITLTLIRLGCKAVPCKDIVSADEAIDVQPVDIMLVDVILPGANGLDLIADWKKRVNMENCRTIVLSAMRFPEFVARAKDAGADDFLVKPIDVDAIIQRVSKWIKQ
jgi:DNA-binding response OmpR family regulator